MQSGSSDPERVLDILEEYIEFLNTGKYTAELFVNAFITGAVAERDIPEIKDKVDEYTEEAKKELQCLCDKNGFINDPDEAAKKCSELFCRIFQTTEEIFFEAPEPIDYRKDRDVVCVIVDRDAESRDINKCKGFISRCRNNGFEPYMTNPCFEM